MKPLFIPLKRRFYEAFACGSKTTEYRLYGRCWNERTCTVGRPVILSCGYGKANRLRGTIKAFAVDNHPDSRPDFVSLYGKGKKAACITIALSMSQVFIDLLNGPELIRAERERQVSQEGWTPEHDDTHMRGEMARAAMSYARPGVTSQTHPMDVWPWHNKWWKPSDDPIRNLVKAGALIAAEIDRLRRADGGRSIRIRKTMEE